IRDKLVTGVQTCALPIFINSINLEDGEEKFERVCPLARTYGAALICGTIDEDPQQAQAFTRERKLAVAERSARLLTQKYGVPPEIGRASCRKECRSRWWA